MKNIHEILKSVGLEVPEEKKEAFDKTLFENYKTISEYEGITGKLSKAESERDTRLLPADPGSDARQAHPPDFGLRRPGGVHFRHLPRSLDGAHL